MPLENVQSNHLESTFAAKLKLQESMVQVSIFMITYKHEKYISEAIESIVNQKTNFSFQLVIGEDGSPDGTRAICEAYQAKYPDLINLLPKVPNMGMMPNTFRTLDACTGKYIAMCEGDDYWLTDDKLQKQYDFLEANPDYSMCFSDIEAVNEIDNKRNFYPKWTKDTYTIEDIILSPISLVPTATLMFRNLLPKPLPLFFTQALAGDMVIQLFMADKGKIKFMNEKLAAYRNHDGGISKDDDIIAVWSENIINTFKQADEYFNYKYRKTFEKRYFKMIKVHLINGAAGLKGMARIKHYLKYMPAYVRYSEKLDLKELIYYHMILFAPGILKRRAASEKA